MAFNLPKLPYGYSALEPEMDKETVEIHHDKHHQGYVNKLNSAIEGYEELQSKSTENLLKDLSSVPEEIRASVRNNGGGHANHTLFWETLGKGTEPSGDILKAISNSYVSFESFKQEFSEKAATLFGSGWVFLAKKDKNLEIIQTKGHDTPLSQGKTPLMVIDMWEHAYYLKYQNRKKEYIEAFWNLVNWSKVNENFRKTE